ncbi:heterokaryon incompatibility protein-domain-containing protein [Fusarium flagelliforme]|uniref:heterokaryon incompatibility protein-domain-containing protein n=1 Tax=Fusarium flagelliforme TaxID=2675880 RepID=UPI001E8D463C|nr:heterokaryon incompatibility protein-domain-containing protein [Fusarium flagelliforme]KAH7173860.1 heterokaryon incompatibility protein-domain-containing protein [Fusarium flagelliforme]
MPHICSDCEKILSSVDQFFTNGRVESSFSGTSGQFAGGVHGWVKAAIEGTCDFCVMMYVHHDPERKKKPLGEIPHEWEMTWHINWHHGGWVELSLRSKVGNDLGHANYVGNNVFLKRLSMTGSEVLQMKALGGEAGSPTWSPRIAKALRSWLDECTSSHNECKSLSNLVLPKRLVDVNPNGTDILVAIDDIDSLSIDALPQVKLCSTSSLSNDTKYLTLSHCWGTSVSIKLSNKLLPIYETQITLEHLLSPEAKVFREAIWVTRCLGYRYLWIDALCINQDDDYEKAVEIARMDQIFSGATANLSATSASSGADGMIFYRKHSLYELFPCEKETATPENTLQGPQQEKKDYLIARVERENVDTEPVNKRAWVFQERILAPRVIHFCKNQIQRECGRDVVPELRDHSPWIYGATAASGFHTKIAWRDLIMSLEEPDRTEKERKYCYRFRDLVNRFSTTLLTFPQDRLASLAGIAKTVSIYGDLGEDQYFAGLWEPDLPRALLWQAWNHFGEKKWDHDQIGYAGPSWSWAGCEAPKIGYTWEPSQPWESLVTLIHVWTVPAIPGSTRFGTLSGGGMNLKGRLVEMHRKRIGDAFLISIKDNDVNLAHELYFESRFTQKFALDPEKSLKEITIRWDRFTKASENKTLPPLPIDGSLDLCSWDGIEPEILHLLPIGQDVTKRCLEEGEFIEMQGLVLHRADTTGSFTRVGAFDTSAPYPLRCNEELRLRLLKVPETELTIV